MWLIYQGHLNFPGIFTEDITRLGIFFFAGALCHIAEDFICGKVPIILPTKKYGVKLFKVGSAGEYFFAAFIMAAAYFIKELV